MSAGHRVLRLWKDRIVRHLPIILIVLGLMACVAGAIHGVSQLAGLLMFVFGALLFLAPRDGEAK